MTAEQTIAQVTRKGVRLWSSERELRFKAPAEALSAADREHLKAHKPAILELLGPDRVGPPSWGQQRLWYLAQLNPESCAYNIRLSLRLRGALDAERLQTALDRVVARHDVFRSTFPFFGESPLLRVASEGRIAIGHRTVAGASAELRDAEASALAADFSRAVFRLDAGPLARALTIRLTATEHWFVLVAHHIICDGWSLQLLVNELFATYDALRSAAAPVLPPLPLPYAEYAAGQRSPEEERKIAAHLEFWRERLGGSIPALELPFTREGGGADDSARDREQRLLPAELVQAIRGYAQQRATTPFVVLLAVFQILLRAYSGREDIVVGVPVANRPRQELESVIGLFLDTLALREALPPDATFDALVRSGQRRLVEALEHRDAPFERVVEAVRPERNLDRHPLFDFVFNLTDVPPTAYAPAELALELIDEPLAEAKFRLTLYARTVPEGLRLYLGYRGDLYSRPAMRLFLRHFEHLCRTALAAPATPIAALSLYEATLDEVVPNPAIALTAPACVPVRQLIEQQASRAPAAVAIEMAGGHCTYSALLERAAELTDTLRQAGVERGTIVAILGERSIGFVAALLAVWGAGGIVLPLDPKQPAGRRAQILQEAGAGGLVVVRTDDAEAVPADLPSVFELDGTTARVRSARLRGGATPPSRRIEQPDAAYVFFTSGSTGTPKGVLGSHRGLSHFVQWQRDTFGVAAADRVAHVTAVSFDVVLREIFTTLSSGATLCVLPESRDLSPGRVIPWLAAARITLLHTVPSIVTSWFAGEIPPGALPTLRVLFFAGEPLPGKLVTRWRERFPEAGRIINLYGPTETTLAKCYYEVPAAPRAGTQPVGRPLPQTQALVLNGARRMCGVGETGEIAIRTPFRTHGYLNDRELTAQRFVPNPYTGDATDLLYLTGDLGRYGLDGTLEILGRRDHQLKIRGVRIEPGEIENALTRVSPAIRAAKVIATPAAEGERRLVAYLLTDDTANFSAAAVRGQLRTVLPDYLIPAAFVPLAQFPVTPNGKIDVRALPPPGAEASRPGAGVARAGSELEQTIARVWQELLHTTDLGIDDNYFDLGGHSLLMIQVHQRLKTALPAGPHPTMLDLFRYPTIRALARFLGESRQAPAPNPSMASAHHRAAMRLGRRPRPAALQPS
jgi:amino acid adenylation domain-containing protein